MAKKKDNKPAKKVSEKWQTTGGAVVPVDLKKVEFATKPKKAK